MMMPAGGGGGGGAPAGGAAPAAEAAAVEEKTHFTIKLDAFDAGSKIKLIKEVRAYTSLGLKEAKELVEKAPCEVKANVPKEEAEEVKAKFEAVGGTVTLD
jgi:large subunit ribosomal protein L7/L12